MTEKATEKVSAPPSDEDVLASFGYKQELRRALHFFSLFAVAFSIISITTGLTLNYSFVVVNFGPAGIWTWLIAGAGQMMLAFIIAELATRIPIAGYAYQWGARLMNSTYGWFVGWTALIFMAVGGAAIILLGISPLLITLFGWNGNNARLVLFIAYIMLVLPLVVNIVSIQLAARINNIAVFTEIIGMVGFGVVLFFIWVVRGSSKGVHHNLGFLFNTTHLSASSAWYGFVLAGLIGIYTLVGFEYPADLSEEAVHARSTVPRAIIRSLAAAIVFGFVALAGFTLAIPSLKAIQGSGEPLVAIVSFWTNSFWTKVFIALVVVSMFALTVVGTAAQGRLMYSLARDNMLPLSAKLRKVNRTTQTPVIAMIVMIIIGAAIMQFGYLVGNHLGGAFAALVGSSSILPYIVYAMVIIAYGLRRKELQAVPGAFSLGRFAKPVFAIAIAWTAGALAVVILPQVFRKADYLTLILEGLAVLWYVTVLRSRLHRGEAGVNLLTKQAPTS